MRRALVPIAGLIACLLLSSCGIGPSRVIDDHPVKPDDRTGTGNVSALKERGELAIGTAEMLIREYLNLAAADNVERRKVLLGSFFQDPTSGPKADGPVNVVRLPVPFPDPARQPDQSLQVKLTVDHLGELKDGLLIPSSKGKQEVIFTVVERNGSLILKDPPTELLLSADALNELFQKRALYFWSGPNLVQDLRYVPEAATIEQRATRLLGMLYGEPADWLKRAVSKPPGETKPTAAVSTEDNNLVVTLSNVLAEPELTKLAEQLARTLLEAPYTASGLQIRVQGQILKKNYLPDPRAADTGRFWRYGIVDGKVYRFKSPGTVAVPGFFGQTSNPLNQNVAEVAFARDESAIALLRVEGGKQQLVLVNSTGGETSAAGLPSAGLSHPMWINAKTLLIRGNEKIYQVDGATGAITAENDIEGLTNYAVASDGRRVALVMGEQVYLAVRNDEGQILLEDRQLVKTGFSAVYAVAFEDARNPDRLFVSGLSGSNVYIGVVNADGTDWVRYNQAFGAPIRHLSAGGGQVLFEVPGWGSFRGQQVDDSKVDELIAEVDWQNGVKPQQVVIHSPVFQG